VQRVKANYSDILKIYMKKLIRKIAHNFGVEISHFRPSSSRGAQLGKALEFGTIDMVFDIGANEGQFSKEIREYGYTGKIVSFEPLSSARKKLLSFAEAVPNWEVHDQAAIGDLNGEIDIHIAGNSVSSSVLPMLESHSSAEVGSAYVSSERVPIVRLDSVAPQYLHPNSNLFIKIDTQGFEWQVLDGASETLKLAKGLLCELSLVPLYHGQRLWRDIIGRLEAEGFVLWALQKGFTDPRTGQSLQMDGIFLRKSSIPAS
jgi:FkbM family methyltransferase